MSDPFDGNQFDCPDLELYRGKTRDEVLNALGFIRDSLMAQDLSFSMEPTDENPDCWSVGAVDSADYGNVGLVGWNKATDSIVYAAHDPLRSNHDEQEGIEESESKCWWTPPTAEILVAHLNGEVRSTMAKQRAIDAATAKTE